jgi:hypothetical protein
MRRRTNVFLRGGLVFALAVLLSAPGGGQGRRGDKPAESVHAFDIALNNGYPELRVDGKPFFIHSAAFFYYRIPRDLWERSLDRHRELGINTLDLYIPWNWHEPREGQRDFEGNTNPRRDLRALLRLIAEKGFKLIARPGPVILNEWRHGGYPEWLLARPEYKMEQIELLEGRYAPLSNLNPRDAEGAARGWLENETHMRAARGWLEAVGRELAPLSARRTMRVRRPTGRRDETEEVEISGPLLFVQLDDDMAINRTNYTGPYFWRYMQELRQMLEAGGVDVPAFINPTDMRVTAAGFGLERPIGAMGQWYLRPPMRDPNAEPGALPEQKITALDASTIEFFVETLKTQPAFPPAIIEYQAAWYNPGDDARPLESSYWNTLLSSRLLLAHGLHGVNYFPLQDTITPAGYSTPWTNRYYRWDAALDAGGNRQFRSRAVARNAQLLELWGEFLASSHKRADFGLIYPLGAYPQETLTREQIQRVSRSVMQIARVAQLAGISTELLDPEYQPVEQLLRHALVVLPVFDSAGEGLRLSGRAQRVIVDFVRRGGMLITVPERPEGKILEELWSGRRSSAVNPQGALSAWWPFGKGRVAECSKDFYSWAELNESFTANRKRFEAEWADQVAREILAAAGVHPAVAVAAKDRSAAERNDLVVTQLISNDGSALLGERRGGWGALSVTNLSYDASAEQTLEILSPRHDTRGGKPERIQFPLNVPPRESLLLPLHFSLCSAAKPGERCDDEVTAAGAELLRAERDGRVLELTFYTPARANIYLRLEREPGRVEADEVRPQVRWHPDRRRLEIELLRGPSPSFLRVLRVHLRYAPRVSEKPDLSKRGRRDYDAFVAGAVRLPLGDDTSLLSFPPLVVLDERLEGRTLVETTNFDQFGREVEFEVTGPIRGDGWLGMDAGETRQGELRLRPQKSSAAGENGAPVNAVGLIQGEMEFRSGRDRRRSPINFVRLGAEGVANYQFDFDRDGLTEWVLENRGLRVAVSPENGGTALLLEDKNARYNLTTTVGALRDHFLFTPNPAGIRPERARGRYGLFNRPYSAEWLKEEDTTALRLRYDAPDVYPNGAQVEKTLRLIGEDTLEAKYQVGLAAAETASAGETPAQAFVAVNSVAVFSRGPRGTEFCWTPPEAAVSSAADLHCEKFVPGKTLTLPEEVRRVEVRNPGRTALALEWREGSMSVDMKNFSALLRLEFPQLEPGGRPGVYSLRFVALPVD